MNKSIYTIFFALITFVGAFCASTVSAETTNGDDDDVSPAPVVVAEASSPVITNGDDDTNGVTSDTSTGGTSGAVTNGDDDVAGSSGSPIGGGNVSGGVTNGDDDISATPTNNGTDTGSNGSSSNGGGSSRNSRSSASVATIATSSCPLITDYLKLDGANDPLQVTKLQIFLNSSEGAGLKVTGIFDTETEGAVMSFQKKYMTDILGPWDATRATGFVYITTMKKINALACAQPITLSADEMAIIEAYKARGESELSSTDIGSADGTTDIAGTDTNENVAAVGGSSIISRFWEFLKSLFR